MLNWKNFIKLQKIVADIKAHRLRWLGHVERMGQHRVPKKVEFFEDCNTSFTPNVARK